MDFFKRDIRIVAYLLFIAVAQFIVFLNIAGFLAPNYSIHSNTISHLGVPAYTPYWWLFSATIIILGALLILSGLMLKEYSFPLMIFLILAGIGSAGVGIINENYIGTLHLIFALFAFLFSSLASYAVLYRNKNLISAFWAFLGTVGLAALILFIGKIHLGLGEGGMERLIVIPNLIWALGFSIYLLGAAQRDKN